MRSRDGRGNGRRKRKAGEVPPALVPHCVKPGGKALNPIGKNQYTFREYLRDFLQREECHTLPDGTSVDWPRSKIMAHMLSEVAVKGPGEGSNDRNWQVALQHVLDRVDPVSRETSLVNVNVRSEHTNLAVTFIDGIREKTGRQDISHDDVLRALEADTFGGNGRDGSDPGS